MDAVDQAHASGVQLVRFLYVDFAGVTRAKALHVNQLAEKLREGSGLTRAMMAMNVLDQLQDVEGMGPVGEIRLVPDPETFTVLPWTPSSASVLCDQLGHDHRNWGACPRSFLKEMVARAERAGIDVTAAFENEFYLAQQRDGTYVPFDQSLCYTSIGLDLPAQAMNDMIS